MHTFTMFEEAPDGNRKLVLAYHNGDWSGDATLHWDVQGRTGEVTVPGWVARALCLPRDGALKELAEEIIARLA